jgi:putative membrane protein
MLAIILVGLVVLEHLYIAYLEMIASPKKQAATFGVSERILQQTEVRTLMGNQGIYNAGIAALIVLVLLFIHSQQTLMLIFLMGYIVVMAVYGGLTANKRIMLVQGGPALLALVALVVQA